MKAMSELEKAAEEYSQYGMGQSGFIAGAKWQSDQSPWHDVSEEPKHGEHICVQFDSGNIMLWYVMPDISGVFEIHNVIKWAYVSGLVILTRTNISANFVLTDVSKQELEKRRIPVYSYLL